VEDWMLNHGGSQLAAQIIVLQGDVTTSQSPNLTTSTTNICIRQFYFWILLQ